MIRRSARALAALVAVACVLTVAACGGTADGEGEGTVTSLNGSPTASGATSSADVSAVILQRKKELRAAVKAFRACDKKVSTDRFTAYTCLKKVQNETAELTLILDRIGDATPPATLTASVADMRKLAEAGRLVNNKCAQAADQVCDQALARFRAHEQSLVWDLQLKV